MMKKRRRRGEDKEEGANNFESKRLSLILGERRQITDLTDLHLDLQSSGSEQSLVDQIRSISHA